MPASWRGPRLPLLARPNSQGDEHEVSTLSPVFLEQLPRPATWEFVWATTSLTTTKPTSYPMAIAVRPPPATRRSERIKFDRSARDREYGAEDRGHQGRNDHGPDDGRCGVRGDDRRQHDKDPEPARPLTDVRPFEEHRIAHVLHVVHFCGSRTEISGAKATVRNVAVPRSGRRPQARSRARPCSRGGASPSTSETASPAPAPEALRGRRAVGSSLNWGRPAVAASSRMTNSRSFFKTAEPQRPQRPRALAGR